jgi:hypothetical protein
MRTIIIAAIVALVVGATGACAEGPVNKPIPPDLLQQIQTPAKISIVGSTLRYDGNILDVSVAEVDRLLKSARAKAVRSIMIKSPGGAAEAGIPFGELVRDRKLAVTIDGYCMSSCANYVAIAARELFVPDGALLGYHGGAPKTWGDDGKMLEEHKRLMSGIGQTDQFFESLLQLQKKTYARQQALFKSVGVSPAILEDSRDGTSFTVLWMFTRDVLERCYNVGNIKQYPTVTANEISHRGSVVKIIKKCPSKVR